MTGWDHCIKCYFSRQYCWRKEKTRLKLSRFWVSIELFPVLFCRFYHHVSCLVLHFLSLSFSRLSPCSPVFYLSISRCVFVVRSTARRKPSFWSLYSQLPILCPIASAKYTHPRGKNAERQVCEVSQRILPNTSIEHKWIAWKRKMMTINLFVFTACFTNQTTHVVKRDEGSKAIVNYVHRHTAGMSCAFMSAIWLGIPTWMTTLLHFFMSEVFFPSSECSGMHR